MTSTPDLRVLLDQVCEARQATSTAAVAKLDDILLMNKRRLIDLLEDKPKNAEHRKSLEAGKAIIDEIEHRVNYDFIREATYLSDHLNVDEYEASRLLYAGISQASTVNSTALDTAVYLYHSERGYVLAILNIILETAKDESVENGIRYVFRKFMADIVNEKLASGTSFINKIITSTKVLSKMISSISKIGMLEEAKTANEYQQKLREAKLMEEQKNRQPASQIGLNDTPVEFKQETVKMRVDRLNEERISLVQILYHIATLYWLPQNDLLTILTKMQNMNLSDNTSSYILTALLAALSFEYSIQRQGINFSTDTAYLKKLHDQITTKTWKVDALKAVVMIQWALFLQVLSKTDVTQNLIDENARNQLVRTAMSLDAFGFMNNYLLYFKQDKNTKNKTIIDINEDSSTMEIDGLIVDLNDYEKLIGDINSDFQPHVLHQLENTMTTFIEHMQDVFQEFETEYSPEEIVNDSRYQYAIKKGVIDPLTLLASIFRGRRDAGLMFWRNGKSLTTFLSYLVGLKLKDLPHLAATLDFLGAISTGIQCANFAHNRIFKIGTNNNDLGQSALYSWGKYFATLQNYIKQFQSHKAEEDMSPVIAVKEEEAIVKYTYLCQQVVQYSNDARREIWNSPTFNTHESIVNLIGCPISKRLRVGLYDLLTAFCSPWGGGINDVGKVCAQSVWITLEKSDMVIPEKIMVEQDPAIPAQAAPTPSTLFNNYQLRSTLKPTTASSKQKDRFLLPEQPAGLIRILNEEKSLQSYTETQSVLHLLANLIHTPTQREELISAFSYIDSSVPRLLGSANRTPGTKPYISLVVDHIFLKLSTLDYETPSKKWQLADTCLSIIENSMMSFNLEPICDFIRYTSKDVKAGLTILQNPLDIPKDEDGSILQEGLLTYITLPGYEALLAILSGRPLVHEMLRIVAKGKSEIEQAKADKNPYFRKCLTRCLRIFSQVLKVQNAFVNVFLPQLEKFSFQKPTGEFKLGDYTFPNPPARVSLRSLGRSMMYNPEVIIQIALMVNCEEYEDICTLSASILSQLSSEPIDTSNQVEFCNYIYEPMGGIGSRQLAGIFLSSPSASSIIYSFKERLEVDSAERTTYDDYLYDMNIIPFWLAENTLSNIHRFEDYSDNYHYAWSIRITILDMLLKNLAKEIKSPTISEFLLGFDVKELETHHVQKKSIPIDVQHQSQVACLWSIVAMLSKGTGDEQDSEERLMCSHSILAEKCYQLIYKLCVRNATSTAILHYLRTNCDDFLFKQYKAIAFRLEDAVAGSSEPNFPGVLVSADSSSILTDYFTLVSILNQRAWVLKLVALELHRSVHSGIGVTKLLELLYGTSDDQDQLIQQMQSLRTQSEIRFEQPVWSMLEIIDSLEFKWEDTLDENTVPQLNYYRGFDENMYKTKKDGYDLYDIRQIYKILRQRQLTQPDTANMSPENREALEQEMGRILKRLMAENRHIEIKHGRLHCLRAWKQVVEITVCDCFDSLPFDTREKIIYDLLSVLLPKLEQDTGLTHDMLKELGELVLVLLNRLEKDKRKQAVLQATSGSLAAQHVLPQEKLRMIYSSIVKCICKINSTAEERSDMYLSLVNILQYAHPSDLVPQDTTLFTGVEILSEAQMEKLLDIICNDINNAGDASEKTAYTAMRALYDVLVRKKKGAMINRYLSKKNFWQYTNETLCHSTSKLYDAVQDRKVSLVSLEAYEAKMSFFARMALDAEGSSQLIDNGVLFSISIDKFARPQDVYGLLRDPENTLKVDQQRRLVKPILELASSLLTNISKEDIRLTAFEAWITKQGVILTILQDEIKERNLSTLVLLQLATTLLNELSDQPGYFDGLDKRGLDKADSLMMKLISKYCVLESTAAATVIPTDLNEEKWNMQVATDNHGHQVSVLQAMAEDHIASIRTNLLCYAQASAFRRSSHGDKRSFKPIFTSSLLPIKDSALANFRATKPPSLTELVSCLACTGTKLTLAMEEFKNLCLQKQNVTSLKYDEILEIASTAIPKSLDIKFEALNQNQKTQVLAKEINHRVQAKLEAIDELFVTIDSASVLLWRHLVFYLSRDSIINNVALSPAARYNDNVVLRQESLYQTSPNVIDQLNSACQTVLEPVLTRLERIPSAIQTSSQLPETIKRIRKCYQ